MVEPGDQAVAAMMDDTRQEHGMSEVKTVTLTEFLTARLDEDEAAIPKGPPAPWHYATHPAYEGDDHWSMSKHHVRYTHVDYSCRVADCHHEDVARHLARWDPARVLAEVEAKRRMLAWLDEPAMRGMAAYARLIMAEPYADHPDYREEWKP